MLVQERDDGGFDQGVVGEMGERGKILDRSERNSLTSLLAGHGG